MLIEQVIFFVFMKKSRENRCASFEISCTRNINKVTETVIIGIKSKVIS